MKTLKTKIVDILMAIWIRFLAVRAHVSNYLVGFVFGRNDVYPEISESTSPERIWQICCFRARQIVIPEIKDCNQVVELQALLLQNSIYTYLKGLHARNKIKSFFALPQ